ncbi:MULTISPECIES: asparagine synthase-related protein [unclassified Actinomyces]|uniref:asparagine synthase-related protein n=1 Tax=unclassified Actinomyces TaxID=2609248 RepID=UPI001F1F3EF9|nr:MULTISPECIES: asparagine synthase-related protein [unclassified Actinomyces]
MDALVTAAPADRRGQWTVVSRQGDDLRIDTDHTRSHHLLFARAGDTWIVSDDPERLRRHLASWRRDDEAADVFLHTGFVVGNRTLVRGVHATPAASTVHLHPDGTWESTLWDSYRYSNDPITSEADYAAAYDEAMDRTVGRLLEYAGDRQLVIPLSGGLDSRLLAIWLKRLKAPRVVAFTYGKPGARETGISRNVADALGIDWFSIDLDPGEVARRWATTQAAVFQAATWGMTSLPHVQDWYALTSIRERSLIADDAVLLPGFAAVLRPGYALPRRFGGARDLLTSTPSRSEVLTAIARNHAAVQGSSTAWRHLPLLREEILRCEKETPLTGERGVQGLMSWFNARERQAKYINNSTKSYEFFGYDWALPMLDSEVWDCWLRGSEELTATRDWYARYIAQHYATMTGQDQELYLAASISLPATPKRVLQSAMRATGGDRLLSRSRSVRTMLDHPMAFEAFSASIPRIEQARRFAAGNTTLGIWTRLFLDNQWGADLVPAP